MELYVKSDLSLAEFGKLVGTQALQSYHAELRDGLNIGGGEYFSFKKPTTSYSSSKEPRTNIVLCKNRGEAHIPLMADFLYYFYVYEGSDDLLRQLAAALENHGLSVKFEDQR